MGYPEILARVYLPPVHGFVLVPPQFSQSVLPKAIEAAVLAEFNAL
jgi:hypothetical protein